LSFSKKEKKKEKTTRKKGEVPSQSLVRKKEDAQ